ncbi:MAG TPA: GerMN domain-containing protein [Armatimonadota bacterium]|nr:GerMN domain-containing protein [Armatimonadota bacterium]HOJ22992.1 GerMN domain-containing protein [Armatimonadota bacterium]HOM83392.1 GerMN domain-containing protein [Armatimonadota bacterium]HPO73670.1 GerMN domain-containing protein [Armatimonadota bacterium]HPT97427.1 GerMN domain-containing protein [Armatimonadota bacterium]
MRRTTLIALLALIAAAGALLWWSRTSTPPMEPPRAETPPANAPEGPSQEVTLYFAREVSSAEFVGWVLVPVQRPVAPSASPEQAVLEALAAGPTSEERQAGLVATLPNGTRVLGVQREDGVITANFSRELQENFNGGAEWEEVVLYSIVNTLVEAGNAGSVRIRIEGEPVESIGGHLAADEPLQRNDDIVFHGNQR